jgi:hypothetical protein
MPTRIFKTILAVVVMVIAGAALQPGGSHHFAAGDAGANAANVVLAESSTPGASLSAMASNTPANQLGVNRPTFSEPFLLLLMGTLLISVGTSFRRWTTRRTPPPVPRRT